MKTKDFKILSPFTVKFDGAEVSDKTNERIIKISGCCNWSGKDADGKTYTDLVGDVVVPSGVDASVWQINPQILLQHDKDQTIGRGLSLEIREDGLYIEAEIHADALDEKDWYRIRSGLLCMFSIGFRCLDGEYKELDGTDAFFITKSLLLEVSIVSIPCNSHSGFSVIKSLCGGSAFGGGTKTVPTDKSDQFLRRKSLKVKCKYADYLSAGELEDLKAKGVDVDQEVEVAFATLVKHIAGQVADERIKSALEDFQVKEVEVDPVGEGGEEGDPAAEDGEAPAEEGEPTGEGGEAPAEGGEEGDPAAEDGEAPAEEGDEEDAKALEDLMTKVKELKGLLA